MIAASLQRGWFFTCFYWATQGIYGFCAATICCFAFGVALAFLSVELTTLKVHLIAASVGVISILVGIQAAYRNHRWIQRRELAKRNA